VQPPGYKQVCVIRIKLWKLSARFEHNRIVPVRPDYLNLNQSTRRQALTAFLQCLR
jgi:hypothetical protein